VETLLSRSVPFTAAFFFSDGVFFEALPLLTERGIRVPEDLAAVGFENTLQGKLVSPGLTTINVPLEEIGERAIDLLASVVEKHETVEIEETCGVGLIMRGST
jgi:DNA-binding LacI/PurR family transcriptional regulator